jgi:hypothetical protein
VGATGIEEEEEEEEEEEGEEEGNDGVHNSSVVLTFM